MSKNLEAILRIQNQEQLLELLDRDDLMNLQCIGNLAHRAETYMWKVFL